MPLKKVGQLTIRGESMTLLQGWYDNDRIAYQIDTATGEPFMKLTVNLPDSDYVLQEGEFFVKTWGENEPIMPEILKSGLFIDTMRTVGTGFVAASVWRLAKPEA